MAKNSMREKKDCNTTNRMKNMSIFYLPLKWPDHRKEYWSPRKTGSSRE